jgi:hypothetical protein
MNTPPCSLMKSRLIHTTIVPIVRRACRRRRRARRRGGPTSALPPAEQAPAPPRRGRPNRGTLSTAHSCGPTPWEAGSGVWWLGRSSPATGREDRSPSCDHGARESRGRGWEVGEGRGHRSRKPRGDMTSPYARPSRLVDRRARADPAPEAPNPGQGTPDLLPPAAGGATTTGVTERTERARRGSAG